MSAQEVNVSTSTSNVEGLAFDDADITDLVNHLDDLLTQVDEIDQLYGEETLIYGAADRVKQMREKAGGMWTNVKSSLGTFFKKLTTRTNGKLPDWVYSASEGVLQSMINYIEERLSEDGDTNKVTIEMLRQGINALRNRIIDASKGLPEPEKPENAEKPEKVEKKRPESPQSD
uniref:Uncharacterized protein n=1 Tax=Tetranychus urticae TaxID=32264 RepID=T1JYS6_TETUR